MKLTPVILAVAIILGIITVASSIYHTIHTTELEGVNMVLENPWFGYVNETNHYAYGAQIIVTNTKSTTITLDNISAEVYGVGGERNWIKYVPITSRITLPPDGSRTIDIYSGNLNTISLGVRGARGSGEGYLYSTQEQMNSMVVRLVGDTQSLGYPQRFDILVRTSQVPSTTSEQIVGDHYSGLFWFQTPNEYFTYEAPHHGVLGTAKFPYLTLVSGSSTNSVSYSMVDARTLTVTSGNGTVVYYLMDGEYKFASYLDSLGKDGDQLYFYGNVMNYVAPNGDSYKLIQLTETSSDMLGDSAALAKNIIISRVGEDYFRKYFSGPSVGYDRFGGNSTHVVTYQYHISVGGYSTIYDITLSFNYFGKATGGVEFVPMQGNLQPFNVTLEKAEDIAVNAGVPRTPFGLDASIGFWSHTPGGPVNNWNDRYVWSVSSWLDPSSSNPRREVYAFIDPISGEVYTVQQSEVASISFG